MIFGWVYMNDSKNRRSANVEKYLIQANKSKIVYWY